MVPVKARMVKALREQVAGSENPFAGIGVWDRDSLKCPRLSSLMLPAARGAKLFGVTAVLWP